MVGGSGELSSFLKGGTPTPPHKLPAAFKFKDYMPKPFRLVRALAGITEEDFIMSVAGDHNLFLILKINVIIINNNNENGNL